MLLVLLVHGDLTFFKAKTKEEVHRKIVRQTIHNFPGEGAAGLAMDIGIVRAFFCERETNAQVQKQSIPPGPEEKRGLTS